MPILGVIASSISGNLTPAYDPSAYDALASIRVTSNVASVTFTNIPAGYKHFEIRGIAKGTRNGEYDRVDVRFNADSGSNYSRHLTLADWGVNTPQSYSYTNQNMIGCAYISGATSVANTFGGFIITVLDYTDTAKYKTVKSFGGATNNGAGSYINIASGNYMSFNPITSVTVGPIEEGSNLATNSVISLYGVK